MSLNKQNDTYYITYTYHIDSTFLINNSNTYQKCPEKQVLGITISNGRLFKSQGFRVNKIEESAFPITRKMV